MAELPKSAHRNNEQKAQGYINAAHDALRQARFFTEDDTAQAQLLEELMGLLAQE